MSIGSRLREARREAKLSQEDLASKSGASQSSISDLERGKSAGTTSLAALASACGVRALWLETGKGPKADTQVKSRVGPPASWFSDEAHDLLELYFSLDDEERSDALRMMKSFAAKGRMAARGDT